MNKISKIKVWGDVLTVYVGIDKETRKTRYRAVFGGLAQSRSVPDEAEIAVVRSVMQKRVLDENIDKELDKPRQ